MSDKENILLDPAEMDKIENMPEIKTVSEEDLPAESEVKEQFEEKPAPTASPDYTDAVPEASKPEHIGERSVCSIDALIQKILDGERQYDLSKIVSAYELAEKLRRLPTRPRNRRDDPHRGCRSGGNTGRSDRAGRGCRHAERIPAPSAYARSMAACRAGLGGVRRVARKKRPGHRGNDLHSKRPDLRNGGSTNGLRGEPRESGREYRGTTRAL